MANDKRTRINPILSRLAGLILGLPWLEILPDLLNSARCFWEKLTDSGMYEVLEHEATLELKDKRGKKAQVLKCQKVRYLQNNITAYQDQAWGDGEILIGYRCSPGIVVDRYQPGQKTHLLISLRETKRRGDVDKFNIEWGFRNGFLRARELWETEVSHRTRQLKIQVIFPKSRPPLRAWLVESLSRRTHRLGQEAKVRLSDGRWLISWKTRRPRLNERYQLYWEW